MLLRFHPFLDLLFGFFCIQCDIRNGHAMFVKADYDLFPFPLLTSLLTFSEAASFAIFVSIFTLVMLLLFRGVLCH